MSCRYFLTVDGPEVSAVEYRRAMVKLARELAAGFPWWSGARRRWNQVARDEQRFLRIEESR